MSEIGTLARARSSSLLAQLGSARDYLGIAVLGVALWLLLIETNAFY